MMLRQPLHSALAAAACRLLRHVGLAGATLAAAAMLVSPAHARSYWYNITGTVFGYQKTIGFQVMLPDDVPNIRGLVLERFAFRYHRGFFSVIWRFVANERKVKERERGRVNASFPLPTRRFPKKRNFKTRE